MAGTILNSIPQNKEPRGVPWPRKVFLNEKTTGVEHTRGCRFPVNLLTIRSVGALRERKSFTANGSGAANSGNVNKCFQH